MRIAIIDGYIDEPTCLGVPPYISPYPRYIAGAIWDFDSKINISYITIDQLRNEPELVNFLNENDIIIIIAGVSVPGRYLSGYPASANEIVRLIQSITEPYKFLCGPAARYGFGQGGGQLTKDIIKEQFTEIITGDPEIYVRSLLENKLSTDKISNDITRKNAEEIGLYAEIGSKIVKKHPNFPDYIITEIETYRGCPRCVTGGCSFCSEPSKGLPDFRPINHIVNEIKHLYAQGIRNIRLGNQPCIFSYMSREAGEKEFPRPNPEAIEELFKKIRNVAPDLKTFHIDNANPGIIARYPDESQRIAKTIIKYHTSGDVAAMGVESVDPVVIKENNLKADSEQVMNAIKTLNMVGRKIGQNGLPELLPGLNFVFGLKGETKKTFQMNYDFLKEILKKDLLVRRINIRQVIPIPGTEMYKTGLRNTIRHKGLFKQFKRRLKEQIERPLLEKTIPPGSMLRRVYTEKHDGKTTFGRQLGSYPILIGIPGEISLNKYIDVKITDHGYRSITGIPVPIDINNAKRETLQGLPGLGKKRVLRILANRPFKNISELESVMDDPEIIDKISEILIFN